VKASSVAPAVTSTTSTCSGSSRSLGTRVAWTPASVKYENMPGTVTCRRVAARVGGPPRAARTPSSTVRTMAVSSSGMGIDCERT